MQGRKTTLPTYSLTSKFHSQKNHHRSALDTCKMRTKTWPLHIYPSRDMQNSPFPWADRWSWQLAPSSLSWPDQYTPARKRVKVPLKKCACKEAERVRMQVSLWGRPGDIPTQSSLVNKSECETLLIIQKHRELLGVEIQTPPCEERLLPCLLPGWFGDPHARKRRKRVAEPMKQAKKNKAKEEKFEEWKKIYKKYKNLMIKQTRNTTISKERDITTLWKTVCKQP